MMTSHLLLLLPLALTLILALLLRHTLLALGAGIISGALILAQFNPLHATVYMLDTTWQQFYRDGQWQSWHLNVLSAMVLLGIMTRLLTRGGATSAFANWLYHRISSRRQARISVVLLGWIVFIDGIFSCLAVGHVSRPLSQRYDISSEQLAYLVDSNASPLSALLPFSSWGPYVMTILASITLLPFSPLESFIDIAKLNFYAITVILLSLLVAWFGIGFEPASQPQQRSDKVDAGSPWILAISMTILLVASMAFTLWSGASQSQSMDLTRWLSSADIGAAMRDACLLATISCLVMLYHSGRSIKLLLGDLLNGVQSMFFAMTILVFTWLIGVVIVDLGVAKLLAGWAERFLSKDILVIGSFLLCAVIAFTTGSSWGTFAIMIPIGAEIAITVDITLLLPVLSAVMAGSVFGDHCSPISDTSVISAISSDCEPHSHVITQLPFAIMAALSSLVGFQLINLGVSALWAWLAVLMTAVLLLMSYRYVSKSKQTLADVNL